MKALQVPDMHCEHCVARIKKALDAENIPCEITLATHTVSVPEDSAAAAVAALDDAGFTAQ